MITDIEPQFPSAVYNTLESGHRCSMDILSQVCVYLELFDFRTQMFPMYIKNLEIPQLTSGKPFLY